MVLKADFKLNTSLASTIVVRHEVLQKITQTIGPREPQSCNLVGLPRVGKTTLLNYLHLSKEIFDDSRKNRFVLIRMGELPDLSSRGFWSYFIDQISLALGTKSITKKYLGEELDLKFLVDQLKAAQSSKGIDRLIFLFDDGEVLYEILRPNDFHYLNYIASECMNFLSYFVASSTDLQSLHDKYQAGYPGQYISNWCRGFRQCYLSNFTYDQAMEFLDKIVAVSGEELTEAETSLLLTECGASPELLGVGFHYMGTLKLEGVNTASDFEDIFSSDLRHDGGVKWLFQKYYEACSIDERHVLVRIMNGEKILDAGRVRRLSILGLVTVGLNGEELFSKAFENWLRDIGEADHNQDDRRVLLYNPNQGMVQVGDLESRLTPVENRLMAYLVANENRTCSVDDILGKVWGKDCSSSVVEKTVNRLRQKIELDYRHPKHLLSIRGMGYELHMTSS